MHTSTDVTTYKPSNSGKVYLPEGLLTWSVPDRGAPSVSPVDMWALTVSYDSRRIPRDVEHPTVAALKHYADERTNPENITAAIAFTADHFPIAAANSDVPVARLKRVLATVPLGIGTEVSPLELTAALVHVGHRVDLRRDLANPRTSVPTLALEWAHAKVTRTPVTASPRHVSVWLERPTVDDADVLHTLKSHRVDSAGYSRSPRTESSPALVAEIQRIADALVEFFPATRLPPARDARSYFPGSYGLKHVIERITGSYVANGDLILAAALTGYHVEVEDGINAVIGIDPMLYDLLWARAIAASGL